LGTQHPEDT